MPTATLTSKSQITVPAQVRHALGLRPGRRLRFTQTSATSFTVTAEAPRAMALAGRLKATRPATLEDMERGIATGAAETMGDAGA